MDTMDTMDMPIAPARMPFLVLIPFTLTITKGPRPFFPPLPFFFRRFLPPLLCALLCYRPLNPLILPRILADLLLTSSLLTTTTTTNTTIPAPTPTLSTPLHPHHCRQLFLTTLIIPATRLSAATFLIVTNALIRPPQKIIPPSVTPPAAAAATKNPFVQPHLPAIPLIFTTTVVIRAATASSVLRLPSPLLLRADLLSSLKPQSDHLGVALFRSLSLQFTNSPF
jgi:hypothetical protein